MSVYSRISNHFDLKALTPSENIARPPSPAALVAADRLKTWLEIYLPRPHVYLSGPHAVGKSHFIRDVKKASRSGTWLVKECEIPAEDCFLSLGSYCSLDSQVRRGAKLNFPELAQTIKDWNPISDDFLDKVKKRLAAEMASEKQIIKQDGRLGHLYPVLTTSVDELSRHPSIAEHYKIFPPSTNEEEERYHVKLYMKMRGYQVKTSERAFPIYTHLFNNWYNWGLHYQGSFMAAFLKRYIELNCFEESDKWLMEHSYCDILLYSVAYFCHQNHVCPLEWRGILKRAVALFLTPGSLGDMITRKQMDAINICILSPTRRGDFIERKDSPYTPRFEDILDDLYDCWRKHDVYLGPTIFLVRQGTIYAVDSVSGLDVVSTEYENKWEQEQLEALEEAKREYDASIQPYSHLDEQQGEQQPERLQPTVSEELQEREERLLRTFSDPEGIAGESMETEK